MSIRIRILPPSNLDDMRELHHAPRYDYLDKGKFYVPMQKDGWIYAGILESIEDNGMWSPVEIYE